MFADGRTSKENERRMIRKYTAHNPGLDSLVSRSISQKDKVDAAHGPAKAVARPTTTTRSRS